MPALRPESLTSTLLGRPFRVKDESIRCLEAALSGLYREHSVLELLGSLLLWVLLAVPV